MSQSNVNQNRSLSRSHAVRSLLSPLPARASSSPAHAWPCADALPSGALPNSFAACQTATAFHVWRGTATTHVMMKKMMMPVEM